MAGTAVDEALARDSVLVSSEGRRRLPDLAPREKKEMPTVARELMDCGWVFPTLRAMGQAGSPSARSLTSWTSRSPRRSTS